jgi:DNA-binding NarL/FixJ family response regulator
MFLTPLIARDVLRNLTSPPDSADRQLTLRQCEVLRLLAQGQAHEGDCGGARYFRRTVEHHKAQLLQVLSLDCTAALIRFAIEQHIVPD